MNRFLGTFLSAFLLMGHISLAGTFSYDSTGITKKGGKTFIIHIVEEGETLFALSRRYHVTVDELYKENPKTKQGLDIGQRVLIPYGGAAETPKNTTLHVVKSSETLYSIAGMYDVSVSEIKKWNNLSGNAIGIGDKLFIKKGVPRLSQDKPAAATTGVEAAGRKTHTVQASETLYSLSRQYDVNITELKKWNHIEGNEISIGQVLIVSGEGLENPATEAEKHSSMMPGNEESLVAENNAVSDPVHVETEAQPKEKTPSADHIDDDIKATYESKKVVENGFAEVIEGSSDTKKYLALHRSAPVGTIMQVRNEMNNQTVFVRVVGKVPDTGNNKNILIKISKKAFNRLGSVDPKFPVEISYIP